MRDEIRALVEDFIAALEFAAKEGPVLAGGGAVGLNALALVVVKGLREALRNLVAESQRNHAKIFLRLACRRLILRIEGIVKVLLTLNEQLAQIEGVEASKDILMPLLLNTPLFGQIAPPRAEGRLCWGHGARLKDILEWFRLASL